MKLVPGKEDTLIRIPVYQAASYIPFSPASLYEHVTDVIITGMDVRREVPAGTEVEIQVHADSNELMSVLLSIPGTDEDILKKLDTSPRFSADEADALIAEYTDSASKMLKTLKDDDVAVDVLESRFFNLKNSRHTIEKKAIVEQYKELLRDIYKLECDTAWERVIRKVNREMALLSLTDKTMGDEHSHSAFSYLEAYIESAKANHDVAAAKNILEEISSLRCEITWKTTIPNTIKWYDRNFGNLKWSNKDKARKTIDEALTRIRKTFTHEEGKDALRSIWRELESLEEIREAEGLLG